MRRISLILCFIFLFSVSEFGMTRANAQTDILPSGIGKEFLSVYEISDPANSKPESSYITRAEMLQTVAEIFGFKTSQNTDVPFVDVQDSLKATLRFALDMNMISESSNFRPTDPVTYNEAIKMCVSALGYEYLASVYGGWPSGYLRVAKDIDLSDGLDLSKQHITPSEFYAFVENLLTAEMLEVEGVSGGEIAYRRYTTVLEQYYDLYEIEGVVTANKYTGLYDVANSTGYDAVVIDGIIYPYNGHCPVGYAVTAYVSFKNNKISVMASSDNKTLSVEFHDVVGVNNGYFEYYNGSKDIKVRLSEEMAYLYNGKADDTSLITDYVSKEGRTVLVDNNTDGIYDVCFLYEDEALVVDGVNVSDGYIIGKNGEKRIALDDDEIIYTISQNGMKITLSDITPSSLITYNMSKDGLYCEIKVHTGQISGIYDQASTAENVIYIDSVPYRYSSYFQKHYQNRISLGSELNLLLTDSGVIYALASEANTDCTYGYYIDAKYESGLMDALTVKYLNSEGSIISAKVSEKLKIDGYTCKGIDDVYSKFFAKSGGSEIKLKKEQIIRYNANPDGELTMLDFASDEKGILNGDEPTENNLTLWPYPPFQTAEYGVVHGTAWYNRSTHIIHPHIAVSPNTVVILANSDTSVDEDKRFKITDRSWFSLGNNRSIQVKDSNGNFKINVYNVDKYGVAGAIVMDVAAGSQVGDNSPSGIVYSVSRAYDDDMTDCYKIVIYHDGEFNDYYAYDGITNIELNPGESESAMSKSFSRFEKGDFVRFAAEENGSLKVIMESYDESDKKIYSKISNHGEFNLYYGMVYSVGSGILSILPLNDGLSGDPDILRYTFPQPNSVIVYDNSVGNIYVSDSSELETYLQIGEDCSRVIIATDSGDAPKYIVYK